MVVKKLLRLFQNFYILALIFKYLIPDSVSFTCPDLINSSTFSFSTEEIKRLSRKLDSIEQRLEKVEETNISSNVPKSIEFFEIQLEEAKEYHQFLKDNPSERCHGMSLSYASKKVKDLKSKYETAVKLWA